MNGWWNYFDDKLCVKGLVGPYMMCYRSNEVQIAIAIQEDAWISVLKIISLLKTQVWP